jgi:transcriptional regulator with XRE-family HTH domain
MVEEESTMFVYRRIRDLREDSDKTQSQISKILNMQLTVYQRYERGEREIPFWVAIKLADYYNVSLDYIAERDKKTLYKKIFED